MKKKYTGFSILLVSLLILSSCNRMKCIEGNGNQISQNRDVNQFTFIEASGSVDLVLTQSPQHSLRIVADENIQDRIQASVDGDKLEIDLKGNLCNSGPITAYISSPDFTGVNLSGACSVKNEGTLNVKDFKIDLSGSSKIDLNLNAANVLTKSSGSSEIHLKGQAGNHDVDMSGASTVDAFDFVVGNYKIATSGA
ncbi:MAG: head GIN domain-containing protein, partial [Daejeonella sp.]